jgi:hypothetical protein
MEYKKINGGRIYFAIQYDQQDLIALIKMRPQKQWHPDEKLWSLPDTSENRAWANVKTTVPSTAPTLTPFPAATPLPDKKPSRSNEPAACVLRDGRIYYRIAYGQLPLVNRLKKIPGYAWHTDEKYWSVPDTPDNRTAIRQLHEAATATTKNDIPEPSTTSNAQPVVADATGQEVITVFLHPQKSDYLCIQVPKPLVEKHVPIVKNIHGRRWNSDLLSWEVPYTQLTLRFLRKYFDNQLTWAFTPADNLPERLPDTENKYQYDPNKKKATP